MLKIVLITNAPTHYRVSLFNKMFDLNHRNGNAFKVLFCASRYGRRKWQNPLKGSNFKYAILRSLQIRLSEEHYLFIPFNLFIVLLKERPSAIITGGFSFATIFIFLFHLITKTPYIIWSGEIRKDGKTQSSFRFLLRMILARRSSGFIAYGTRAGEYLRKLDSKKHIFYGWNTVDTEYFSKEVAKLRAKKNKFFEELKLPQKTTQILTIGYLVKGKGFENLLQALKIIKENYSDFILHIIGDGSEKENLINLTKDLGLRDNVRFWGYKQMSELPSYFAIADFFVFPSLIDIWGLVLNEAMAAGLPVIASKYAGSTCDLIQDGVNGFIVDPKNPFEMAEKILILLKDGKLRKKMGKNATRRIKEIATIEKSADGFIQAIDYALTQERN